MFLFPSSSLDPIIASHRQVGRTDVLIRSDLVLQHHVSSRVDLASSERWPLGMAAPFLEQMECMHHAPSGMAWEVTSAYMLNFPGSTLEDNKSVVLPWYSGHAL